MRIEVLSKGVTYFDMRNVIKIILEVNVNIMCVKLDTLFDCQVILDQATVELHLKPKNDNFIKYHDSASSATTETIPVLEDAIIEQQDLVKSFKI